MLKSDESDRQTLVSRPRIVPRGVFLCESFQMLVTMEGDEKKMSFGFGFKKVAEKRDFRATGDRRFAKEVSKVEEENENENEG